MTDTALPIDTTQVRRETRLFKGPSEWVIAAVVLPIYLVLPLVVSTEWANVLAFSGVIAVAALGLNLLTGFAGQASLGTAAFMAIGTFVASYYGRSPDVRGVPGLGQPFLVYLPIAIAIGAVVGFVVGLPALRLRGNYLVIVTLGFIFITIWVLNLLDSVSGGNKGVSMPQTAQVFGFDFARDFDFFGMRTLTRPNEFRNQGLMYLVWAFVAIVALLVKNIVRSRPGRALQAVRDRDVAAEVVGISLFRYKVGAFVVSSAIGSLAGVLYALYLSNAVPKEEEAFGPTLGLQLSILILTVIIVGGLGSVYGTVLGAVILGGMPAAVRQFSDSLPFIAKPGQSGMSAAVFSSLVFSALLVITLVTQPNGIAGAISKLRGALSRSST
ncbi:MAG: branched-chain amino acid ABC transporter permease [Acidimicrobiia bacterium]